MLIREAKLWNKTTEKSDPGVCSCSHTAGLTKTLGLHKAHIVCHATWKNKICKLNFLSVPVRTNCCLYLTCSQVNSCRGGAPCWTSIRAEWNHPNREMCSSVRVRTLRANQTTCWRSQTSKIHQRKTKPADLTVQRRPADSSRGLRFCQTHWETESWTPEHS